MNLVSRPNKRRKVDVSEESCVGQVERAEVIENRLPFLQGDVIYVADFIDVDLAKAWYTKLLDLDTWFSPRLKMYGREFTQSRQIAAYAKLPFEIEYSGTKVKMQTEYPPILQEIEEVLRHSLGIEFNHCMLNRYDDGSVYIGKHRDNLENRVIASISLGAERDFIMTHDAHTKGKSREDGQLTQKRWSLKNGSLLIMQGQTQRFWKHEIPKQLRIKQGRISLTFRQMQFGQDQAGGKKPAQRTSETAPHTRQ